MHRTEVFLTQCRQGTRPVNKHNGIYPTKNNIKPSAWKVYKIMRVWRVLSSLFTPKYKHIIKFHIQMKNEIIYVIDRLSLKTFNKIWSNLLNTWQTYFLHGKPISSMENLFHPWKT